VKDLTLLYNFFHEITVCGPSHSAKPERNDPPSSWSEEDKALFASLPRLAQERLAECERVRASELAEQRKAVEADRAKLDAAAACRAPGSAGDGAAGRAHRPRRHQDRSHDRGFVEVRDILRQRLRN
jgi:hypothetical protein